MFTLGRKIDFNYTTNKIILGLAIIVAAIGYFITGDIKSGLYIGGGTFLTWALAREVDPKNEYSAFYCGAMSLINLFFYKNIQLMVIFWIILLLRLVNGISGKRPTLLDLFSTLGLTIYLTINMENSIYLAPLIISMVFLIHIEEKTKMALTVLLISIAVFLIESLYFKYYYINISGLLDVLNIAVIIVIFINFILQDLIKIKGALDDKGNPIVPKKIRTSQILFGFIVFILYLFEVRNLNNLIIYFSVILGTMFYSFSNRKDIGLD